MITGGELADPADCQDALRTAPGARLLNAYGLTETTITSALFDVGAEPAAPQPSRHPAGTLPQCRSPAPPAVPGRPQPVRRRSSGRPLPPRAAWIPLPPAAPPPARLSTHPLPLLPAPPVPRAPPALRAPPVPWAPPVVRARPVSRAPPVVRIRPVPRAPPVRHAPSADACRRRDLATASVAAVLSGAGRQRAGPSRGTRDGSRPASAACGPADRRSCRKQLPSRPLPETELYVERRSDD